MSEYVQALVELVQVLDKAAYGSNAVASTHRIDDLERRVNSITGTTPDGGGGDPDAVKLVGDQIISGTKEFVEPIIVPENTFPIVAVIGLRSLIDAKAEKVYVDEQGEALSAALTAHTHTVDKISDSGAMGRTLVKSADAAAARTAIGAGTSNVAVVTLTQAAYAALGTKDPNTIYFIQG